MSSSSGSYGINIGGLVGQGPIFRFTPSARPRNVSSERNILFFPIDYTHIDHHVSFIIKSFKSVTRTSSLESDNQIFSQSSRDTQTLKSHITLPMPTSLVANYTMDYANPSLSPLGELLAHAASIVDVSTTAGRIGSGLQQITSALSTQTTGQNVAQAMTAIQTQINSIFATVQNQGSNLLSAAAVGGAALAARNVGGLGQAVIANLTGVVANPHKVILFQGVDHRNHVFSFELSPRNYREAKTIIDIIYQIKLAMHPKYGVGNTPQAVGNLLSPLFPETAQGLASGINSFGAASRAFFEYPDIFEIEFAQADKNGSTSLSQSGEVIGQQPSPGRRRLFTIGECVLQGFSVNYHPLNFPAYVASIEDPASPLMPSKIDITMSFKETDIVTKDQIERYNR